MRNAAIAGKLRWQNVLLVALGKEALQLANGETIDIASKVARLFTLDYRIVCRELSVAGMKKYDEKATTAYAAGDLPDLD